MRLGILVFLLLAAGCAHVPKGEEEQPVWVTVQNASGHGVCAVHLWTDEESYRSVENKLLPGAQLLERTSAFRLHDGSRRDFVVPAVAPLRMEAVDCDGHLVESREIRARAGSVVSLALTHAWRG
jgi:hypothetical protein